MHTVFSSFQHHMIMMSNARLDLSRPYSIQFWLAGHGHCLTVCRGKQAETEKTRVFA